MSITGIIKDLHNNSVRFIMLVCLTETSGSDNNTLILREATKSICEDEVFKISAVPASTALTTAKKLYEWMIYEENKQSVDDFSKTLVERLKGCIEQNRPTGSHKVHKAHREKMWRNFHALRVSTYFKMGWNNFLILANLETNPLLYQRLSDLIMEKLIKRQFSDSQCSDSIEPNVTPLTYEDKNALRYVAGYVCDKLRKKISASKLPSKESLLLCLSELCDEDEVVSSSADWVNAIDRGGLCCINENTFGLFAQIEIVVRSVFNVKSAHEVTSGLREKVKHSALKDEDVIFYWYILTTDIDTETGNILLSMIVDLYVTIRGFSFAKSFMELYKQSTKKATQKTKGLRKTLLS